MKLTACFSAVLVGLIAFPARSATFEVFPLFDAGDVLTDGTFVEAVNAGYPLASGNVTVNGVVFSPGGRAGDTPPGASRYTRSGGSGLNADAIAGLFAGEANGTDAFDNLFNSIVWQTGTAAAGNTLTLSLPDLTPGADYRLQLFFGDSRAGYNHPFTVTVGSATSATYTYGGAAGAIAKAIRVDVYFKPATSTETVKLSIPSAPAAVGGLSFNAFSLHSGVAAPSRELALRDFNYNRADGSAGARITGLPRTAYKFVKSTDLDFSGIGVEEITLTSASPGKLAYNELITDATGEAAVSFMLGNQQPSSFLRAEEAGSTDTLDLLSMVRPVDPAMGIISHADWYYWGGSMVKTAENEWQVFACRWPREFSFACWMTHAEIVRLTAPSPLGPFAFQEVALGNRGPQGSWNEYAVYNPKIEKFGDTFYLYYCSTYLNGDHTEEQIASYARAGSGGSPEYRTMRANQRTGAATNPVITGQNWQRTAQPIVEPAGPIITLTVNPGVCQGPDGNYVMIVKGDRAGAPNQRNQAIALADHPLGPWVIQPEPAISTFDTEDASIWYDKKRRRFYAIYHAHSHFGLITSRNGVDWQAAAHPVAMNKRVELTTGAVIVPNRFERPYVVTDAMGQPLAINAAMLKTDGTSANVTIPLAQAAE